MTNKFTNFYAILSTIILVLFSEAKCYGVDEESLIGTNEVVQQKPKLIRSGALALATSALFAGSLLSSLGYIDEANYTFLFGSGILAILGVVNFAADIVKQS